MYVGLTSKHKNVQGEYCTVLNNYSMYTFTPKFPGFFHKNSNDDLLPWNLYGVFIWNPIRSSFIQYTSIHLL